MLHTVEKQSIGVSNYARAREAREVAITASGATPRRADKTFDPKVAFRIRQPHCLPACRVPPTSDTQLLQTKTSC